MTPRIRAVFWLAVSALFATALAGCVAPPETLGPQAADATAGPFVTVALIDTGINPYHAAFRDYGPLAYAHPSTYLAGFPADAPALRLSLNATHFDAAWDADADVWANVAPGTLYWIPGTRIVGAISLGPGGTNCPPAATPPFTYLSGDCPEHVIYDDHGHGTMTASRAAAAWHSLAPTARIVAVEGGNAAGVRWAADAGFIDVQSNSWLDLVPPPASQHTDGVASAFAYAAERMVTIAASGNGAAYLLGFAPTPTYVLDTAAPGVILVGAHDNGFIAPWSGAPAHVLADGFGGPRASRASFDAFMPHPDTCCTSAAAPYVAGAAAALILDARQRLGDRGGAGVASDGVLAAGDPGGIYRGPLADGVLTVPELRATLLATAEPRPTQGPDDGLAHWTVDARRFDASDPAGNPYCLGCWTVPLPFTVVPPGVPLVAHVGYGAVDPEAVRHGRNVLAAFDELPVRAVEDAFFALDAAAREAIFAEAAAALA